ncbi:MAG: hypothetical protein GY906_24130 [bacterium]|nr:hypothetical protein [bacterium]
MGDPVFRPVKVGPSQERSGIQLRDTFEVHVVGQVNQLAERYEISSGEMLRQMVQFALEHMEASDG